MTRARNTARNTILKAILAAGRPVSSSEIKGLVSIPSGQVDAILAQIRATYRPGEIYVEIEILDGVIFYRGRS